MKFLTAGLMAVLLICGISGSVSASLIGDDVYVDYIVNGTSYASYFGGWAEVDAGMETPEISNDYYEYFFDADRLRIDFVRPDSFGNSTLFSGIALSSLNDVENPDWILLGVDVQTDLTGWSDDRIVFDETGQYVGFSLENLSTAGAENFTAIFEFGPNPIPIPATMTLFVTGLIGFIALRRLHR
jgi:hypothetical protein